MAELQELPTRMAAVESQILQLRGEMHDGFSAIHRRFEGVDQRFEGVDQRFDGIDQRLDNLTRRMTDGHEEAKRHAQVLHEELIARISLIQEGGGPRTEK